MAEPEPARAAGVIARSPQGRVLMLRRVDDGSWSWPGGWLKDNGMSVTGARRAPFRRRCGCRSTRRDGCSGYPLNYTTRRCHLRVPAGREEGASGSRRHGGDVPEAARCPRPAASGVGDERAAAEGARLRPEWRDGGLPERRLSSSEPRHDPPPVGEVITLKEAVMMTASGAAMAARDRWLLDRRRWRVCGCSSAKVAEVRGRIVSHEGLRREFPRLYAELIASEQQGYAAASWWSGDARWRRHRRLALCARSANTLRVVQER